MSLNWASPYESATRCTGSPTQGARALLAWCLESYPTTSSLGIYNCRSVAGTSTTSLHGEGRAVDLAVPMVGGRGTPLGHSIVQRLGTHGVRLGIQAIVYDRKVWSARSPTSRAYTGAHPHYDHLHIELTRNAASRLTLATFRAVLGSTTSQGGFTMFAPCKFDDRQSAAVGALQTYLKYTLGLDIGSFGPGNDGIDEHFGGRTASGLAEALGRSGEVREFGRRQWADLMKRHHTGGAASGDVVTLTRFNQLRAAYNDHAHSAGATGVTNKKA